METQQTQATMIKDSQPQTKPAEQHLYKHEYTLDWTIIIYVLISFMFGVGKYLYEQMQSKEAIKKLDMLIHALVSGMSGYVASSICIYLKIDPALIGPIAGVAGFAGVAVIKRFEDILINGLGERLKRSLFTFFESPKDDNNK